ncbi:3-keto-steroid reductase [Cytospora mali]|uniref:3-keto-steroid reductase n=1 Tax=Cytospora mali TaxID=578113 RepID=A0A194UML0_CYTMA|nr:3-keto-steroid reductase [Valsa mali var. pyri (nom. inval.)]
MAPAPWESVPARDTTFSWPTPSGIGLGICQRLIDEFLTTRSPTSHLTVIPTTRDARKSAETIALLRKHLHKTATSPKVQARGTPESAARRVHITSVQLDLCDFATVRRAADQLLRGTLPLEGHGEVRIPRLDAVIFNAGIGGWTGVDWLKAAHNLLTAGWVQATTWPTFKSAEPGLTVNPLPGSPAGNNGTIGQVFCANVFGHYLFAHAILPLLTRRAGVDSDSDSDDDGVPPGRLIWESSLEAAYGHFTADDFQGTRTHAAYESTKRLTDLLCLTADLPSVRPHARSYWEESSSPSSTTSTTGEEEEQGVVVKKPKVYLCHPGIVVTTIFPLPLLLFYAYKFAMYISRWIGSPWHTNTSYTAAVSMVWLALAAQETLDAGNAQSVKWGSACDFWGNALVKKTEVDGWGWEGRVEGLDDGDDEVDRATGVLRKIKGRRGGAEVVTEEKMVEFEEMGAKCWLEMERLRSEWEVKIKGAGLNGHA